MPSPFPGMKPSLEQADVWQDFHQSFIPPLRQLLSVQVCPRYVVKIAEQIFIHELAEEQRQLMMGRADLTVSRMGDAASVGVSVTLLASCICTCWGSRDSCRGPYFIAPAVSPET